MRRLNIKANPNKDEIPEGPYCYDNIGPCPFFEFKSVCKEEWDTYCNNFPVPMGNTKVQYCKLLQKELSIPDMIKDCGINDDFFLDE